MNNHSQYSLPTAIERAAQSTQSDFELKQANVLNTAKDLVIKQVFSVTNTETAFKKGQRIARTAFSGANYTAATSDYVIGITSLAIAPTIGLPLPALVGSGKTYIIKDEVGGAATTTITIQSEGEKTIDGSSSLTITSAYGAKRVYSDGANWFTL